MLVMLLVEQGDYVILKVSRSRRKHDIEHNGNSPSNTRIAIDPPCSSNASLAVEYPELVKSKLLF